jgi:hypothetical protein
VMTTMFRWPRLTCCASAATALAALGWCAFSTSADEPNDPAGALLAAFQPGDDNPRGDRDRDRRPEEDRRSDDRPEGDRSPPRGRRGGGPDDRGPRDRPPEAREFEPRAPGARGFGEGGFGGGGFGAGGPRFGPPGRPGGDESLDERIARLERKLDVVLDELRMLRRERPAFGPMPPGARGGARGFGMAGGPPRGPIEPPRLGRDMQRGPREWDSPPGMRRGDPPTPRESRDRDDDRRRDRDRDDDLTF